MSLKVVPKPACDPANFSESWPSMYSGKNRPKRAKERRTQKLYAVYRIIFKISKCFHRSNKKLHVNFSLELGRLNILKLFAHVQNVLI